MSPGRVGGLRRAASAASENAVALGFLSGWRLVRLLPERQALALFRMIADEVYRRDGKGVQRLRSNLGRVRPDEPDLDGLTREAVRSYMRYWCESFRLPSWPIEDLVARTVIDEPRMREILGRGKGMVAALPHMANWDWAGAWTSAKNMPAITVAERLKPERLYDEFVAYRTSLGVEILSLTGEAAAFPRLMEWVEAGGLACLLADRDLSRTSVEVELCGQPARMPRGPALLARRTGAPLVPATLSYDGPRMVVRLHDEVPARARRRGPGADDAGRRRRVQRGHPGAPPGLAHDAAGLQRRPREAVSGVRIGIVCPYSLDTPGGVQNHVRDLAEALIARGHHVSVLAPSENEELPPYVVGVGRAVPVPYNGAVARLAFGPVVAGRVRRWLRDGDFDVVHLHEPHLPSVALLALWAAECPVVATWHGANERSRALLVTSAILRPSMEKVNARIAVSDYARDTMVHHLGGELVVIPNGVFVDRFARALPRAEWSGPDGTLAFVGRFDEPRKGFGVLLAGFERLVAERPGVRLLVVGGGDVEEARSGLPVAVRDRISFLGRLVDEEKARALATADLYVAPNTGGESFGIILVEAMSAGATVLASDIPAFQRVLGHGRYGVTFRSEDGDDLARQAGALLDDPDRRAAVAEAARTAVRQYDWSSIASRILQVYETVVGQPAPEPRR